ncbi:DTW domain-containing protein YfiP [Pseudomonas nitritireducens]|uniref:tRNA-uridine aminocarboxypropyltransferase n=1 Tax=Pseudomonas nitroreducens TaxID=46680 RepID=A0A7W7KK50_PSENT|nr:DTW domain-containing protein [Pseudomonas nitritireducens]MBB4863769.1 DTW domain-containing protein YfiP [Pseudomonas nitritireducens]
MTRARCPRCERLLNHCLCALIPRLDNRTRVLLLQHPSEVGHALNTARLAALRLANAQLRVGEDFSDLDLSAWDAWLLFPGEAAVALADLAARPVDKPRLLVVPDGTWRKARKLLHLNPNLAALPRVVLPDGLTSRYRLRKAPAEGALSTIEAVVHALDALDAPQSHAELLRPFDALIEGQIAAMGEETFLRNHGPRS